MYVLWQKGEKLPVCWNGWLFFWMLLSSRQLLKACRDHDKSWSLAEKYWINRNLSNLSVCILQLWAALLLEKIALKKKKRQRQQSDQDGNDLMMTDFQLTARNSVQMNKTSQ